MSAMWRQIKLGKVYTFVSSLQKASGSKSPTNWFSVIVESKQTAMGSLQNSSQHNQFVTNMISLSSLWQLFRRRMLVLSRLCLCLFNGIAFFRQRTRQKWNRHYCGRCHVPLCGFLFVLLFSLLWTIKALTQ